MEIASRANLHKSCPTAPASNLDALETQHTVTFAPATLLLSLVVTNFATNVRRDLVATWKTALGLAGFEG